jgi:glycerol transport system substrate-binding protein
MQSGRSIYDAYVNDSDLIGTHSRYGYVVPLTDFMAGEGADVTSPTLELEDFIGLSFTTGPDGKLYQLPDQQFANLYWFRKDWFDARGPAHAVPERYGYDLGVPVNWSAYEDIAEFFTEYVRRDRRRQRVYGHMDYGKKDPSLGWRFTDAWLSMAGTGSTSASRTACPWTSGACASRGVCRPAGSVHDPGWRRERARRPSTPSSATSTGSIASRRRRPRA